MMETLGDQFGLPVDQMDVARVRKAVRAGIEAYERTAFEEVSAKWDREP
jgi:hypothetical protein